jgi:hypothetical protein
MKRFSGKVVIVLFLAVLIGLCIGWVDSRPTWDDTGITVGVILGVSALLGAVARERPWLVAIAIAASLSVLELALTGTVAAFFSFIPAFLGAYAGALTMKIL